MKRISDSEQTNFVMHVERLYAAASRLRDIAYADNWDNQLADALEDVAITTDDVAVAAELLA